jgi:hypothetical protein
LRVQPGSALIRALINLQVKRVLAAHATQWLMRVAAAAFR